MAITETSQPEEQLQTSNGRKTRADKDQPRLYVEIPGVRYDISQEEGRAALKCHIGFLVVKADESQVLDLFDSVLAIVDRLLKKHGVA